MAAAAFSYNPFAWVPPHPPVPPPEVPLHRPAPPPPPPAPQQQKGGGGFFSGLNAALTQAARDVERGISKLDRDTHVAVVDAQWRGRFSAAVAPSEPLLGDWYCRSFDASGVSFGARVLLYGLHLCAALTAPDAREAVLAVPLTHVRTWEPCAAQQPPPGSPANALPLIVAVATAAPTTAAPRYDAVRIYTADGRMHMLYGFSGPADAASRFVRTFDPAWRAAFPPPPPVPVPAPVPAYSSVASYPPQGPPSVYQPR